MIKRDEYILEAVVYLALALACAGVVTPVFWYKAAQEASVLRLTTEEQSRILNVLSEENNDLRYKVRQANRMLAMAYPNADINFISE